MGKIKINNLSYTDLKELKKDLVKVVNSDLAPYSKAVRVSHHEMIIAKGQSLEDVEYLQKVYELEEKQYEKKRLNHRLTPSLQKVRDRISFILNNIA